MRLFEHETTTVKEVVIKTYPYVIPVAETWTVGLRVQAVVESGGVVFPKAAEEYSATKFWGTP